MAVSIHPMDAALITLLLLEGPMLMVVVVVSLIMVAAPTNTHLLRVLTMKVAPVTRTSSAAVLMGSLLPEDPETKVVAVNTRNLVVVLMEEHQRWALNSRDVTVLLPNMAAVLMERPMLKEKNSKVVMKFLSLLQRLVLNLGNEDHAENSLSNGSLIPSMEDVLGSGTEVAEEMIIDLRRKKNVKVSAFNQVGEMRASYPKSKGLAKGTIQPGTTMWRGSNVGSLFTVAVWATRTNLKLWRSVRICA